MSARAITALVFSAVFLLFGLFSIGSLFENLDSSGIMVVQSPVKGNLTVHVEPGLKWQGFGRITKYPRRAEYPFYGDAAKKVRFNDGGHGQLHGAVSWEMPLAPDDVLRIHRSFGSQEGVERQALSKMIDSAVYLAGPLMSSTESSGERRAELVQYINDQAENGVYVTKAVKTVVTDPLTNAEKETIITEIVRDKNGMPKRQQSSILADFKIKLLPVAITSLEYDKIVEDQIAQRQKATTQVQIAQAQARRAEQDAITAEKEGEASAMKSKWDQEIIKAKQVTEAQQKLEVATLAALEAEQFKREQILRGEGEAERKRLVMEADGALDPKLQAYIEVNKNYASAIASYTGAWVPQFVMGGTPGQETEPTNGAQTLIDLLSAKTARDLSLDLTLTGNTQRK